MRLAFIVILTAACTRGAPTAAPGGACEPAVERRPFRYQTSGFGAPRHAVNDVVVAIGEAPTVRAKLAYGPLSKDLEGEEVTLVVGAGRCGPWRPAATVATDDDGWAELVLPPEAAPGARPFHVIVHGDGSRASGTIYTVAPGTPAVLFDVDGTLTTGDGELLEDLAGGDAPDMRPGADEVARRWAAAGRLVVYITGRPYALRASTQRWLAARGFPPGPLVTVERHRDALPRAGGVGAFKRARIAALIEAGLVFDAAYGNAATDVCAYAEAGIPPERTWILQPRDPCPGFAPFQPLRDYLEHADSVPRS